MFLLAESVWEPPKEGYLSIAEQKDQGYDEAAKQIKEIEKQKRITGLQL